MIASSRKLLGIAPWVAVLTLALVLMGVPTRSLSRSRPILAIP